MRVSYYPGCSLEGTAKAYNTSTLQVCRTLDVELLEVPEWSCCGSSPALKMNRLLSLALAAHNLALAEHQGLPDMVAPCPFCFRRVKSALDEISTLPEVREKVEQAIDTTIKGTVNVQNLLGFIRYGLGLEAVAGKVVKPLQRLKLIPYYGCYVVKPPLVTGFDHPEHPTSLDELLGATGAEVIDWDFKTECCGAGLALSKTDTVCELSGRLIREAAWKEADAIVVVCQLCQANLDMRQAEISSLHRHNYQMPVVYFTQMLGLAFGLSPASLGLGHHIVDPLPMLKQKGLVK